MGRGPRHPHPAPGTRAGDPRRRLVALLVVCCLLFTAVVARLAYLQVLTPETYAGIVQAQRVRSITLPADRGSIFDRNGHELAMSIRQHTVWADPRLVTDPAAQAGALASVLDVDEALLRSRLSQSGAFVYLARQVDDDVAARVEALDLPGVGLLDEPKRFRPSGDLAASLIGSVGLDNDGLSALELQFDEALTGIPGELLFERAPDGRTIAAGQHRLRPAARGDDLVLTIDRSLQYETERALAAQVEETSAEGGIAILMHPSTGEVLALANIRTGSDGRARPSRDNMALTSVFEPGSVNKVITLAAAVEEGLYRPDDVLDVPDRLRVSTHVFTDHDPHPTAPWSLTDIMTQSSNVGTILVAQELGKDRIDRYLRAFGFGTRTGLDFPDESAGLILDPDGWSGTSIGSVPIGQGLAVTALQMLGAFNTVANGGEWVAPQLVRGTVGADGVERPRPEPVRRRVVSEDTAAAVRGMLANVVHQGTGTRAAIDGYTVAGKTGTARKPQATGGYQDAAGRFHYISTFAGFVPAENPQLSMIVVLDEPTPIYAGLVSAPVFADVAQYALRLLRIPPADPATLAQAAGVPAARAFTGALEAGSDADSPGGSIEPTEPTP